jgi:hypothetical protein
LNVQVACAGVDTVGFAEEVKASYRLRKKVRVTPNKKINKNKVKPIAACDNTLQT